MTRNVLTECFTFCNTTGRIGEGGKKYGKGRECPSPYSEHRCQMPEGPVPAEACPCRKCRPLGETRLGPGVLQSASTVPPLPCGRKETCQRLGLHGHPRSQLRVDDLIRPLKEESLVLYQRIRLSSQ